MNRKPIERGTRHFLTVAQAIRNPLATIAVLTLALLFMEGLLQAQSPKPMEPQCMTAVQGKVT